MNMLDRIKKRTFEGFKDFVLNMETTTTSSRQQILMAGILEDPIFMTYIMKNVRSFEDFFNLPSDEIDKVVRSQEQILAMLAKCLFGLPSDQIQAYQPIIPNHMSKLKDELSYLKEVPASEKEGARKFILQVIRKLQMEERIQGFPWILPESDVFHPRVYSEGKCQIHFDSGILAAEGEILKGRRHKIWKHYYDTGKIMAEGEYSDGLKSGAWVFYFANGKIKSQGKYKTDEKQGQWTDWDRAGVQTQSEYNEGVKKS